jgi:integrase
MCKQDALEGNYSNHSGRVTTVTCLYDAGVPEQAIMKRSGHRSIEGVRTYQREDMNEKTVVLNVLSGVINSFEMSPVDYEALVIVKRASLS